MIVLGFEIVDRSFLRGIGRKVGRIQKESLLAVAEFWHKNLLPRHFTPGNRARYRLAPRSKFYLEKIKPRAGRGQGKFVDLELRGQSRRFMLTFATFTGSKDRITIRMKPPRYFANPFIGSYTDPKTGKTKRITRQPNKPDEVTRTNEEDLAKMRDVMRKKFLQLVTQAKQERRERITA
jgi:hypothetical protein